MGEAELFALAEDIVNSTQVIGVYAACEWDELHDDGKVWIAAVVREAQTELLAALAPFARLQLPARAEGNAGFYSILHKDILAARAVIAKATGK